MTLIISLFCIGMLAAVLISIEKNARRVLRPNKIDHIYPPSDPVKIFHTGHKGELQGNSIGILTVVTEVTSNGYVRVGFSFCSPRDRFIKKNGIARARSRMFWVTKFTGHSMDDVIRLFNYEMKDNGKPNRWKNVSLCTNDEFSLMFYSNSEKTWDD